MSDFAKVRAILDAARPGPWTHDEFGEVTSDGFSLFRASSAGDCWAGEPTARAIVVARNLAPELLAVAEAAEAVANLGGYRTIDPGILRSRSDARIRLRAALTALDAKMKETLT